MKSVLVVSICAVVLATPAAPADAPAHESKYAGLHVREIKSLSAEDIEQLRMGHGWGLSLIAELNGVPGPRHLLELKEELDLSADQVTRLEEIYAQMKRDAVPLGEELIRLEGQLDAAFADRTITEQMLDRLLGAIAETRKNLRKTHLSAHLKTPPLLTRAQILGYGRLRGYGEDPCRSVPPGHDPEMWRKHNHCD